LIKELNPKGDGWGGTYIGQPMPATDYWYSIQLEDGRIFKGHFALKR
jgi:gliding motility-associated-like protein